MFPFLVHSFSHHTAVYMYVRDTLWTLYHLSLLVPLWTFTRWYPTQGSSRIFVVVRCACTTIRSMNMPYLVHTYQGILQLYMLCMSNLVSSIYLMALLLQQCLRVLSLLHYKLYFCVAVLWPQRAVSIMKKKKKKTARHWLGVCATTYIPVQSTYRVVERKVTVHSMWNNSRCLCCILIYLLYVRTQKKACYPCRPTRAALELK